MKSGTIILILLVIGVAAALIFLKPSGTGTPFSVGGTNTMDIPTDINCSTATDCKAWLDQQGAPTTIGYSCVSQKCVFKDTYVPTDNGGAQ
jgi:hypothetical protein